MKTGILAACVAGACLAVAAGPAESIRIKATQKTEDRKRGDDIKIGPGQARSVEKVVFYRFEFQRVTPSVPEDLTLKYVLLVSGPGGRIMPGPSGERTLKLPVGQTVVIESESVKLSGLSWEGAFAAGKAKDEIHGYGVRLLDAQQKVIAEKIEPKSAEADVQGVFEKADRPAGAQPARESPVMDPRRPRPLFKR